MKIIAKTNIGYITEINAIEMKKFYAEPYNIPVTNADGKRVEVSYDTLKIGDKVDIYNLMQKAQELKAQWGDLKSKISGFHASCTKLGNAIKDIQM